MIGRQREPELRQALFDLSYKLIADELRSPAVHLGLIPVRDKRELGEARDRLQRIGRYHINALGGGVEVVGIEAEHRDLIRSDRCVEFRPGDAPLGEFVRNIKSAAANDAILHLDPVVVDGDIDIGHVKDNTRRVVDGFFRGQIAGAEESRSRMVGRKGGVVYQPAKIGVKGRGDFVHIGLAGCGGAKTRADRAARGQHFQQLPSGRHLPVDGLADRLVKVLIPSGHAEGHIFNHLGFQVHVEGIVIPLMIADDVGSESGEPV